MPTLVISRIARQLTRLVDQRLKPLGLTAPQLPVLAAQCDGVIHLAFNHDFARFAENGALDRAAIDAMGAALVGSGKPLIVTAGLGAERAGAADRP